MNYENDKFSNFPSLEIHGIFQKSIHIRWIIATPEKRTTSMNLIVVQYTPAEIIFHFNFSSSRSQKHFTFNQQMFECQIERKATATESPLIGIYWNARDFETVEFLKIARYFIFKFHTILFLYTLDCWRGLVQSRSPFFWHYLQGALFLSRSACSLFKLKWYFTYWPLVNWSEFLFSQRQCYSFQVHHGLNSSDLLHLLSVAVFFHSVLFSSPVNLANEYAMHLVNWIHKFISLHGI